MCVCVCGYGFTPFQKAIVTSLCLIIEDKKSKGFEGSKEKMS